MTKDFPIIFNKVIIKKNLNKGIKKTYRLFSRVLAPKHIDSAAYKLVLMKFFSSKIQTS